ncbi:hypothetical protein DFH29DRAFT_1007643 [Suillus ampliporus]|nr:hypothetical protein DFH29DRAFT_1007643 [Suillus ampliporus]
MSFNTIDAAWHLLADVQDAILITLAALKDEFKDSYYGHKLRGKKNATMHDGEDEFQRCLALNDIFEHVDARQLDFRQWHIDVALTIGLLGHIVTWCKSSHCELLNHLIPDTGPICVTRLMNNKQMFHLDRTLQIKELAGFRVTMTNVRGADGTSYVQAYSNELLERKTEEKIIMDLDIMNNIFFECTGKGDITGCDGCAHLEVWVLLDKVLNWLPTLPEEIVQCSVVAINRKLWWFFVYYCLAAIHLVLINLVKADARACCLDSTLALGAVCIYMLNACFTRPAEGFGWESLIETSCQQVLEDPDNNMDDEDTPTMPILYDSGTYFICNIVLNSSLHQKFLQLPVQRTFDPESMAHIYQKESMANIKSSFSWSTAPPSMCCPNPGRTNNCKRKTCDDVCYQPAVCLAGRDVDLYILNGGDEGDLDGAVDDEQRELMINKRVSKIYEQFFFDIIKEAPNQKSRQDGSYLSIPVHMRSDLA